MLERIRRQPRTFALLFAAVLALPTTFIGYTSDDYMHQLAIDAWRGIEHESRPKMFDTFVDPFGFTNPYHFFRGDPKVNAALVRSGDMPFWWISPNIRISFLRPLSSFTLWFDHAVLAKNRPAAHVHSILWYLLLVLAFATLLGERRHTSLGVLALVLFAIDDVHFLPTAWLANRNALVAAVPAIFGLALHVRGRQQGRPVLRWIGLLGFAVGLAGGEAALGAFLYLFAYEVLRTEDPLAKRAAALAPAVVLGVAWSVFYRAHGYGAQSSGLYIDPTGEPLAYLSNALVRIPVLLGGQLGGISADATMLVPATTIPLAIVGVLVTAVTLYLLSAAWPSLDEDERRFTRWMGGGALLSLLPVIATFPLDRLLLLPSLGGAVVLSVVLRFTYREFRRTRRGWLFVPYFLAHVIFAPIGWVFLSGAYVVSNDKVWTAVEHSDFDRATLAEERVYVMVASDPMMSMYLGPMMDDVGWPTPQVWSILSMAPHTHRVQRIDERTFELHVVDGAMLRATFDRLMRGPRDPFHTGDTVELPDMTATIVHEDDGAPTVVRFRATFDLDDPSVRFLAWRENGLKRVKMPPPGQSVALPWSPGPIGM